MAATPFYFCRGEKMADLKEVINELRYCIDVADQYDFIEETVRVPVLRGALELLEDKKPWTPTFNCGKAYCGKCSQRIPKKHVMKSHYCSNCGCAIDWPDPDWGIGRYA